MIGVWRTFIQQGIAARATVALALPLALAACVNVSKTTEMTVWSSGNKTFIAIDIPTKDIHFNWHGGGWMNGVERFKITIPRFKEQVSGPEIALSLGTEETPLALQSKSHVAITGTQTCNVVIALFDPQGAPYKVNGQFQALDINCRR
jgi:hypothetical protein